MGSYNMRRVRLGLQIRPVKAAGSRPREFENLKSSRGYPYSSLMTGPMRFDWDDAKAEANEAKHGVPFEYAAAIFLDPNRLDFDASRPEDNEDRRKVVGVIEGRIFTVVYTLRDDVIRLISARRANDQETRRYA